MIVDPWGGLVTSNESLKMLLYCYIICHLRLKPSPTWLEVSAAVVVERRGRDCSSAFRVSKPFIRGSWPQEIAVCVLCMAQGKNVEVLNMKERFRIPTLWDSCHRDIIKSPKISKRTFLTNKCHIVSTFSWLVNNPTYPYFSNQVRHREGEDWLVTSAADRHWGWGRASCSSFNETEVVGEAEMHTGWRTVEEEWIWRHFKKTS